MLSDTVVLGAAIHLTADEVEPFLRSLRNSGYTGDVVLAVDHAALRQLRRTAATFEAQLLWTPTMLPISFRRIYGSRTLRTLWAAIQGTLWRLMKMVERLPLATRTRTHVEANLAQVLCTPMEARFLQYRRFLLKRPYARVLLVDVRDVLFQSDPFRELPVIGLAVSIESRRYTIATESHNSSWMRMTYGEDMLAQIGGSPVSCVGVTYGDRRSISAYLERMAEEIVRLPSSAARHGGADTAIHNMLIWTQRLGPVVLLETLNSPVATLNAISEDDEVRLSSDGRLLNRDGSEPSLLHQYDRLPLAGPALRRVLAAAPNGEL